MTWHLDLTVPTWDALIRADVALRPCRANVTHTAVLTWQKVSGSVDVAIYMTGFMRGRWTDRWNVLIGWPNWVPWFYCTDGSGQLESIESTRHSTGYTAWTDRVWSYPTLWHRVEFLRPLGRLFARGLVDSDRPLRSMRHTKDGVNRVIDYFKRFFL